MYIGDIFKYLNFKDKVRFAIIDKLYRNKFLAEKLDSKIYDRVLNNDSVKGLETLLLFHTNLKSLDKTYNFLLRAMRSYKYKIYQYMIYNDTSLMSKAFKFIARAENGRCKIPRRVHKYFNSKKRFGFRSSREYNILNSIHDIIKNDDIEKFKYMYKNIPHSALSYKNLLYYMKTTYPDNYMNTKIYLFLVGSSLKNSSLRS